MATGDDDHHHEHDDVDDDDDNDEDDDDDDDGGGGDDGDNDDDDVFWQPRDCCRKNYRKCNSQDNLPNEVNPTTISGYCTTPPVPPKVNVANMCLWSDLRNYFLVHAEAWIQNRLPNIEIGGRRGIITKTNYKL